MLQFCPVSLIAGSREPQAVLAITETQLMLYSADIRQILAARQNELLVDKSARIFKLQNLQFMSQFFDEICAILIGKPTRFYYKCSLGVTSKQLEIDGYHLRIVGQDLSVHMSKICVSREGAQVSVESRGNFTKYIGNFTFSGVGQAQEFCLVAIVTRGLCGPASPTQASFNASGHWEAKSPVLSPSAYRPDKSSRNSQINASAPTQSSEHSDIQDVIEDLDKTLRNIVEGTELEINKQEQPLLLSQVQTIPAPNPPPSQIEDSQAIHKASVVNESLDELLDSLSKQKPLLFTPQRENSNFAVKSSYQGLKTSAELSSSRPIEAEKPNRVQQTSKHETKAPERNKRYFTENDLLEMFEQENDETAAFDEDEYFKYLSRLYIAIDAGNRPVQLKFKAFVDVVVYLLGDGGSVVQRVVSQISKIRNLGDNTLLEIDMQDDSNRLVSTQVLLQRRVGDNLLKAFKLFVMNGTKPLLRSVE